MNKPITGIDYASNSDKAAIVCLSCYREDCEHIQNLRRISVQVAHEGAVSDIIKEPPLFTPSPAPISPTTYDNVFPPITSEGIQEAAKHLRELRAQWDKEDAENLAGVPMHEPLPPRVPDLCPDDWHKEPCVCLDGTIIKEWGGK